jgi:hypothetical protein
MPDVVLAFPVPPLPLPALPPPPILTQSGRPARTYRRPRRFIDEPPPLPVPIPSPPAPQAVRRVILHVRDSFRTGVNNFGILREYLHRPSWDPEAHVIPEDLANFPTDSTSSENDLHESPDKSLLPPWPFQNMSKYLLMNWAHTGSAQKSEQEITRLVSEVINHENFHPKDLVGFSARQENKVLDRASATVENMPLAVDGWHEVSVKIEIPVPIRNSPPQIFHIPGFHYRSIIQVLKATWGGAASRGFHLTPFRRIHVDAAGEETRIFDEVYTSEAWELAHDHLQKQQPEPGCKLEKVIAGLMFWSDSTHLANFGTASVWPIYMYFANLSKYIQAKPSSGACHHLAYIPSVCCHCISI